MAALILAACGGGKPAPDAPPDGFGQQAGGPKTASLTVVVSGEGVVSASPARILDCAGSCSADFVAGSIVTLSAAARVGFRFGGWSGACSGAATCYVTLDGPASVLATFLPLSPQPPGTVALSVSWSSGGLSSGGRILSSPAGIDCGATCGAYLPAGSTVQLLAAPFAGSVFTGWGGACAGLGTCEVILSSPATVTATFAPAPAPPSACDGLLPAQVPMKQFVRQLDEQQCLPGMGDAAGNLALPAEQYPSAGGVTTLAFIGADGTLHASVSVADGLHAIPQPAGIAALDFPADGATTHSIYSRAWGGGGADAGDSPRFTALDQVLAPDPRGGFVVAGHADPSSASPPPQILRFTASAQVAWTSPLASAGSVYGAGVDDRGNALVITDGTARFGAGAISAQWFDPTGAALTGEFLLIADFTAGYATWFETGPLIGGGLAVMRRDGDSSFGTAQWLVTVAAGSPATQPAPQWLSARPNTHLAIVRGGRAYAFLPIGQDNGPCSQSLEVVSPQGDYCGRAVYGDDRGTCRTFDLALGADGTVLQQLPPARETQGAAGPDGIAQHTCTWRWWQGVLR